MKKWLGILCATMILLGTIGSFTAFAAGSMTATANKSGVVVGNAAEDTVTITVNYNGGGTSIGSLDTQIRYNASTFTYVSCSGATASGNAGIVAISWFATDINAPTSVGFSVTFKAKAAGSGDFVINTISFKDDSDAPDSSLGSPSKTLSVTATNPTLSGNANLKSLKPSTGTLTPAFNANTTAYSIKVPYTTTSLSLSAVAAQSGAKVSVDGSNSLKVGNNTQVVTVTAPNGTTKKYTVTITRLTQQTNNNQTTTTAKPIPPDALKAEVDGAMFTVADSQPSVELPSGYVWDSIELNGVTVSAAKNEKNGLTLLYLIGETAESNAFFIYDDGEFSPFRYITTSGAMYVLDEAALIDYNIPAGTVSGSVTIGEQTVNAYLFEDEALKDVALVFAVGPDGHKGLYVYDTIDGSMQRYREFAPSAPVETQPEEEPLHPILQFIVDHRTLLLIIAAGVGAIGLLTIAIVLIVRSCSRPNNCQH